MTKRTVFLRHSGAAAHRNPRGVLTACIAHLRKLSLDRIPAWNEGSGHEIPPLGETF